MLPTDPQHYASRVVTHVLGGGADSRLFRVLRERESWTYDVDAGLHRYRGLGYWSATAQVRTEATDSALRELLHQVRQIRTEPVPEAELSAAKGFLVGSFPLSIETSGHIASQVATVKLLGLDVDYLRLYRDRLNAVTAQSARLAAQRLFHVDALTIVVAGDGAKLYDRLKAIAPVRIVDVAGHALSPAALVPQSGRLPLDPTQIRVGRDSFTVLIQGAPVGTRTTLLQRTADSLVFTESLTVPPEAATVIIALLDPSDLTTKALDQSGTAGGQRSEIHLRFAAGRVKGRAILPQPGGAPVAIAIDTAIASGPYYTEFASNVLIRALPLRPMATFSIPVFSVGDRVVRTLNVQVAGMDTLTVPAGTFRALKVTVSGGEIPMAFYVSEASPRRILKVEILETPVVFELVR
jgi:hypothetical protein